MTRPKLTKAQAGQVLAELLAVHSKMVTNPVARLTDHSKDPLAAALVQRARNVEAERQRRQHEREVAARVERDEHTRRAQAEADAAAAVERERREADARRQRIAATPPEPTPAELFLRALAGEES